MILVDTDVLIAHLRGQEAARSWLEQARKRDILAISAVTIVEITGGLRTAERREVWRLLASLHTESVTPRVGQRAGEFMRRYRRSHAGISLGDYLMAATADVKGMTLATLNVRHFPMFDRLEPPFDLE